MTAEPRLFADDAAIRSVGERMLACTLPKAEWTHAAHFAAALWLMRYRPDLAPASAMPGLIRAFNEAVGGVNSDTAGYHETITQCFLAGVRVPGADGRDAAAGGEGERAAAGR